MNGQILVEKAYINGQFVKGRRSFNVVNPATGEIIAAVPDLTIADCHTTIDHAYDAWPSWRDTAAAIRANTVRKWYDLIMANKQELARIMTMESGKPLAESLTEVDYGASFVAWFAEEAQRAYGETIPSPKAGQRLLTIRQPVGVVAAITPWNFPLAMITRKVAPALACGCTVVLRPASQTPLTAFAVAKLAHEAGFPAGVLNVITGKDSKGMGTELATNEKVRKISFTGSTEVGRSLMAQAAATIKRVSFELGGNAPFLVFDDADINAAVQGAIAGKFRNSGQTCVSVNRFFVQDSVFDSFAKQLTVAVKKLKVGNGLDEGVQVGPLINQEGLEKVKTHVKDAVDKGAKLLTGGKPKKGLFFQPTVLADVSPSALIAREETFGPVCALFRFSTEEEGIAMANDTEFGLASYFYSNDVNRCWRVAEQLEAGMVGINTGLLSNAVAPFGGVKQSGIGREGSKHGIDEYTAIKYFCFGS
ncbi:succinate-semialdehyde dehydrogenase / glutarate-semialdehyde dehydrogenase [Parapedobacter luteus]|uniref:Succinate-semialdehyde dehydrogenase / glutarate-semialdehyde dehydrogenase n=1 Tax=Parapedobacter luteus TaxID=623280 RepID=A0A1T5BPG4_9SPHI|nr:NAD-dependent succinate-semialdehyde dehydrogenase [Parapedobacter luteus]SKB48783.1 succinate-semialdehyde dehydrogenase / glutarate-semialdehyde dehydrogenase [Parapedobacter luteus]